MNVSNLTPLAISILMKCHQKPITKKDVTQFFKSHTKEDRDIAINLLLDKKFIDKKQMPKPGKGKIPTFYFITALGEDSISTYLKQYPK